MLFNSLAFFVFFPIVVALFFGTPPRARWIVLLAASGVFYAWWRPQLLILLFVSIAVGWGAGMALARREGERARRVIVALAVTANMGMLAVFKYVHPAALSTIFGAALPVGLSFYTFQTVGYVVDVHRRHYDAERHFGRFALFVAFFPHLVAGPIMRGSKLLPQFRETQRWSFDRAASGMGWILWGFFKKVVIADRAGHFVDAIYGAPEHYQGATVVVATWLFAFQLYGDFSGYSDIAFGAARVLGFDLMQNFDRPFASRSMIDFWRRWHISFSTWFLDYVYVPLSLLLGRVRAPLLETKRGRAVRTAIVITIVFLLSGLWHGWSGAYVLWGALQAVLVVATAGIALAWRKSKITVSPPLRAAGAVASVLLTFNLVCLGLALFRAESLGQVHALFAQLPVDWHVSVIFELTHVGPAPPDAVAIDLGILVVSIVLLEAVQWWLAHRDAVHPAVRLVAWPLLCVWVVLAAVQSHAPFIYFAF